MKRTIKIGDKTCTFYKNLSPEETNDVMLLIKHLCHNSDLCSETEKNLKTENCGSTIITSKRAIVLLSKQTSKAELLNTFAHEVRHVVDAFIENMPGISPAQLTGDIFSHFADWL